VTLPIELLRRRGGAERYDAVIVGAGIAGLTCAAVLARGGLRVVVVDQAKRPGGQLQTVSHQGYAIDLGPLVWDAREVNAALAAAGVRELGLTDLPVPGAYRVAIVEGGSALGDPHPLPLPGAVTSPVMLDAVRLLYAVPPRVFAAVGELYTEIAALDPAQDEDPGSVAFGAWLEGRGVEPQVRAAALRSVALLGAAEPAEASLAAIARHARWLNGGEVARLGAPGDDPVAGARGVVQGLVDALIDAGGELRLGTRATGMALDRGRFRAVAIQREEPPFAEELTADRCILALPPGSLADLLPSESRAALEAELAPPARARLGVAWAFRQVPIARSGKAGAEAGVLRLVAPAAQPGRGHGGARPAGEALPAGAVGTLPATLVWTSAHSARVAPPEHGLLLAQVSLSAVQGADVYQIALTTAHLRAVVAELYRGVDDLVEWERHWVLGEPWPDPFAAPRLPAVLPGCDGLFAAGAAAKITGELAVGVGAAALSGLRTAERILTQR
jgi:monoamine oxidase